MRQPATDLVSVIIPVFNSERFLDDCLQSVVNQSYTNLEIVIVNDGSTDGSETICEKYAVLDARVKVITKANGGLSSARNVAIDAAKGRYIAFVDSDDIISPCFIAKMVDCIQREGCEIASIRSANQISETTKLSDLPVDAADDKNLDSTLLSGSEVLKLIYYRKVWAGMQFRLYSASVFDSVRCLEGVQFEDIEISGRLFQPDKKYAVIDQPDLYFYRVNTTGITSTPASEVKLRSFFTVCNSLKIETDSRFDLPSEPLQSAVFSLGRGIYARIPWSQLAGYDELWEKLRSAAPVVLKDSDARRTDRFLAGMAVVNRWLFYQVCRISQRAGIMR